MKRSLFLACLLGLASGAPAADFATTFEKDATLAPTTVALAGCEDGDCLGVGCDAGECQASGCEGFSCDAGCDGGVGGYDNGLLGYGLIKHSDRCFNDFISPMTNPVFFEDPRTLTEARFIFLNHNLPAGLGGNSVQVFAMQVRAALTERLSIIATKDGLIYTQSPVLDSGYADIAAGLKYNLYRDPRCGRLLSTGFTFEAPTGSNKSLQGNGNGEFNFFTTGGTRILNGRGHFLSATGLRAPADDNLENRLWYWSNHLDMQLGSRPIYAFTEVNWYNYLSSASAFALPVEGGDIFNLGSPGITGNDLVTQAVGLKAKPKSNIETGIAYEFPLTEREGLMADRLTLDFIVRY